MATEHEYALITALARLHVGGAAATSARMMLSTIEDHSQVEKLMAATQMLTEVEMALEDEVAKLGCS